MNTSAAYLIPGLKKGDPISDTEKATIIINNVCNYYQIDMKDFMSRGRKRHLAIARQIAAALMHMYTNLTCTRIGELIGRDHTTVLHSIKVVESLCQTNKDVYTQVKQIESDYKIAASPYCQVRRYLNLRFMSFKSTFRC